MSLMQQAVDLNSHGVKLLSSKHRNYEGAVKAMSHSISLMKQELTTMAGSDHSTTSANVSEVTSAAIKIVNLSEDAIGESDEDIVFNQAISISYKEGDHIATEQDIQVYSGAVIYNIALANHHQAIHQCYKTKGLSVAAGKKAEKLYDTAIKLLSSRSFLNRSQERASVLVQLACCNNLAQLRFHYGAEDSARECLDVASSILAMTDQSAALVFNEPVVQGLILSAFFLRTPPQLAAAA